MKTRFIESSLICFSHSVWVHCPKCQKKATIHNLNYYCGLSHQDRAELPPEIYCEYCGYFEKRSISYQVELKRNCPNCGKFFQLSIKNLKEKKEKLNISCPHCGKSEYYRPHYLSYYENSLFGSQLWLQKPFRGHNFWAYNAKHLAYLKAFIIANLRERTNQYYSRQTYTSYLPAFIKAKKNREGLLRVIR